MRDKEGYEISLKLEEALTARNPRGMNKARQYLTGGYLLRAANTLLCTSGEVLIITGFPVEETFETDGPAGAISLYQLCERQALMPIILSDPCLIKVLANEFRCLPLATGSRTQITASVRSLFGHSQPGLIIAIERPGATLDGHYYNIAGENISSLCSAAEPYLENANCPTIAIGDGGNEIGMGNITHCIDQFSVRGALSQCDELIVSDVSNWGAYALCALVDWLANRELRPDLGVGNILGYLVDRGAVDGVTGQPTPTEDGFSEETGIIMLNQIQDILDGKEQ